MSRVTIAQGLHRQTILCGAIGSGPAGLSTKCAILYKHQRLGGSTSNKVCIGGLIQTAASASYPDCSKSYNIIKTRKVGMASNVSPVGCQRGGVVLIPDAAVTACAVSQHLDDILCTHHLPLHHMIRAGSAPYDLPTW